MACKADDSFHLEANKSPNMTDNGAPKTSCSNHEDRVEKIDMEEEYGGHEGRQGRELSMKNKEVLNSSRAQANNNRAKASDQSKRSKKGQQHKKRKSDEEGSKSEEIGLKMRIKRKKMATRQSKTKRGEEEDSPLSTPTSSPSPVQDDQQSMIMEERRGANKEKKRKLSCSSSTPSAKGLSSPKPTSSFSSSHQHTQPKRGQLTLSSSSAPTSPSSEPHLIRSHRSSTPQMMDTEQVGDNKKLKIDTNRQEDEQEKPIASLISATLNTLVPVSREKSEQHDAGTWVRTIGTITESECMGPCEPGTSVTLEGIVWNETKGGILVVNVTWRGKTYVGTLLDCTKYDWAPPHCDSPSTNENDSNGHWSTWAHPNHRKSATTSGNGRGRKGNAANAKRHQHLATSVSASNLTEANSDHHDHHNQERTKKQSTNSGTMLEPDSPILFQCPFGSCEKKFSAVVGLKYHQTTCHRNVICKMADKHLNHFNVGTGLKNAQDKKPKLEGDTGPKCMDVKPNLDDLFKSGQPKGTHGQGQDQQQTNSPVYSDISEDDGLAAPPLQPIMDDTITPVIPQLAPVAITEKPMAIVEPQCAPSTSSTRPSNDQRSLPALLTPKIGQGTQKISRETEDKCPPLLPTLESNGHHKKPPSITKLEPVSPRSTSRTLEFAVPAPPSSSPLPMAMVPSSMTHSNRPSPSPINMINQLNHPAFMFNPFNPANAAMFPGGQMVPQSVFQSQAASLMAAGQQSAAGMYGSQAAFMGLHSPPGSLFGGPPPGYAPPNLGMPPSAAIQLGPNPAFQSSNLATTANRLQQAHKIHELTEHAKRVQSAANDTSMIVEALRRSQVANLSPSPRARQIVPSTDNDHPIRSTPGKPPNTPSTAVPTSVIASCDTYGSPKSSNPTTPTPAMDTAKQQQTKVGSSRLQSVSPPVQRHLHTHHHTHTTYPLLAPSIDPYSAIVASQQAAAAAAAVGGYQFGSSAKS